MTLGFGTQNFGSNPFILRPSNISSLALGPTTQAAFRAATTGGGPIGLTFERAAGNAVTVQTSPSTRVDGISGAANIPLIGNAGFGRGVVMEGSSANYLATVVADTRDLTSAGWSLTAGTRTYINAADPAGPNAAGNYDESRIVIGASQSIHAQSGAGGFLGVGSVVCGSAWIASPANASASPISAVFGDATFVNAVLYSRTSAMQPWQRAAPLTIVETAAAQIFYPCNSFTAVAEDLLVDACQVDSMGFPCEYKPGVGAGAARTADSMRYIDGATVSAASGRLSVWLEFIPKGGTIANETPPPANCTTYTLCTFPNGFARINLTSKKVEIQVNGGATATSANAIVWAQGDVVEIFVAVGNGIASVLKYRRNGGAWTDLVMATTFAAVISVGDLHVFSSGAPLESMWIWGQSTATYKPGHAPHGV